MFLARTQQDGMAIFRNYSITRALCIAARRAGVLLVYRQLYAYGLCRYISTRNTQLSSLLTSHTRHSEKKDLTCLAANWMSGGQLLTVEEMSLRLGIGEPRNPRILLEQHDSPDHQTQSARSLDLSRLSYPSTSFAEDTCAMPIGSTAALPIPLFSMMM